MTFAEYLRSLWLARGYNKSQFARAIQVSYTTVNAWDLHGILPKREHLVTISEVLGLSPSERAQLVDLAMPGGAAPTTEHAPPKQSPVAISGDRSELERLLTQAIDPSRHSFSDAAAVFSAISEAASLAVALPNPLAAARHWLDAAAMLRTRGAKVTAPLLLVALSELCFASENQKASEGSEKPRRK